MRGQVKVYQKKIVARRRRRAFLLTLYAVAAAVLLLSALSYVSRLDSLSIRNIVVEGNHRLSTSTVEAVALNELSGNYWYFFSRSNSLLYPQTGISRDIAALPAVKRVDVSRRGLSTVVIDLAERDESARYCGGASGESRCYSIDENGLVFAKADCDNICIKGSDATSTASGFIYRGLLSGDPVGQNILTASEFKNIQFFMRELSGLSIDPREAELSESGYMTVLLGQGGKLVINTKDDLSKILGNIASVISDKSVAPSLPQFLEKLDYMKLDTGNKIVYKLK